MQMQIEDSEVEVTHRMGVKSEAAGKARPMVVRCVTALRQRIFNFTKNLKEVRNQAGDAYYIRPQLPESLQVKKKERDDRLRQIRQSNAQLSQNEQHKKIEAYVKNKTLYVNKVPQKQHIFPPPPPPTVQEIFNTDIETKQKMENIELFHSMTVREKQSSFTGHIARVKNSSEIRLAYRKMRLHYPECDHIMMDNIVKSFTGHHDHGEYGTGAKIVTCLAQRGLVDTVLFVTREYGGIHLGPRRFAIIEKVAREAMNML